MILGYYQGNNQTAAPESLEFGYVETPNIAPLQPPTNGVGRFLETVTQLHIGGGGLTQPSLPSPVFRRQEMPLMLQDDITFPGIAEFMHGFYRPTATAENEYIRLNKFLPIWQGCVVASSTFTGTINTGNVRCGFEVLEDIFDLSPEVREALKGGDLFDFFGRLTEVLINQNSLINLFPFLWGDPLFQAIPNPQISDEAIAYLSFLEAFGG